MYINSNEQPKGHLQNGYMQQMPSGKDTAVEINFSGKGIGLKCKAWLANRLLSPFIRINLREEKAPNSVTIATHGMTVMGGITINGK